MLRARPIMGAHGHCGCVGMTHHLGSYDPAKNVGGKGDPMSEVLEKNMKIIEGKK